MNQVKQGTKKHWKFQSLIGKQVIIDLNQIEHQVAERNHHHSNFRQSARKTESVCMQVLLGGRKEGWTVGFFKDY